ncbi:MAG: HD domain-containing protein [Candidatus Paceibacterota bacterium]
MTLDRVRECIQNHKDRESFMGIVLRYYPPDDERYLKIEKAYHTAKVAFAEVVRDGGDRYFEHLRSVALILMVHLRVRDTDVIIAALLHDIVEDIEGWDYNRVRDLFGPRVAMLVWYVTKPKLKEFGDDKRERDRRYHENLLHAPRESVIIKLADRLHNLLTLWETDAEKRSRKIQETQDFYLALAEKECILIHELEDALRELQAS